MTFRTISLWIGKSLLILAGGLAAATAGFYAGEQLAPNGTNCASNWSA